MKSEVHYCQYIVCMMDLMGQKKMYETLESYSMENENHDFLNRIIDFIRSIEYFKKDVDSFFNSIESYKSPLEWPKGSENFVSKFTKNTCKIQRFSDGIMVFSPLADTKESAPISSMLNALLCTASTMLSSLAKGNPIRVGIGIGGGVELEDGELFGPAIGYAHEMESKKAIYPRIAIHSNIIEYLNLYESEKVDESKGLDHQVEESIAVHCKKVIKLDDDGVYYLDYLGDYVWLHMLQGGDLVLLKQAFDFVTKEKLRFEVEKDECLIKKYSYLYDYFIKSRPEVIEHA